MLVNLTPHAIVVRQADGSDRTYPPSGDLCRCTPVQAPVPDVDGEKCSLSTFGPLEGLPAPRPGTTFIVSTPAAQAAARQGRTDVVSPDTGPSAIRENGQVRAVLGFQKFVVSIGEAG